MWWGPYLKTPLRRSGLRSSQMDRPPPPEWAWPRCPAAWTPPSHGNSSYKDRQNKTAVLRQTVNRKSCIINKRQTTPDNFWPVTPLSIFLLVIRYLNNFLSCTEPQLSSKFQGKSKY